ncbi:ABC transporter ATP-binding protein [Hyphococcus flavus]|uniref:ABC transporter ATP-binding protein n=1 Tax=Hyphococcus flavus TaxID=1866326 RepID=A0AAE9ZD21_9PROT|nr:ABC transporter ATP-binding protein [Hyphococcus flavus]WDI30242.1 ABC transporter ATP-binding protein [Hyphococcus flavus]
MCGRIPGLGAVVGGLPKGVPQFRLKVNRLRRIAVLATMQYEYEWNGFLSSEKTEMKDAGLTTRLLGARLWRDYLVRYWPRLALALGAMAVYSGANASIAFGVEWIFGALSGGESAAPLARVSYLGPLVIVLLGLIYAGSLYAVSRLNAGATLSVLRDIQTDMFDRLTTLDFAQVRGEVSGQFISRFTNDVMVMREMLTRLANGVRDALTFLGLCAAMIWFDAVLFLIIVLVYGVVGVVVSRIGKIMRSTSRDAQAQAGDVTSLINESVSGARMVRSYQLEPLERARAGAAFDDRLRLLKKLAYTRALNEPLIFIAGSIAIAIIIGVVALRISSGDIAFSEFTGFMTALLLLSQPARGLGTLNAVAQEGFGAFERMIGLIDMTPAIKSAPDAIDLPPGKGAITFDKVSFSYGDKNALEDISLEIPAGKMVALVGASGAGKSTLINLLPRLYDCTSGRILLDGEDIRKVSLRSLRARMALVSQEAILFNMSALENIAFGRPEAGRADIIRAAESAAANEFISTMLNGYDTVLGEGGANLSGGQRQRIALARAFLKDAPILLLDEATSALDAESETKIQEALVRLTKGRTTLVIAHRLSTVKDADMIVVMDKGRIIETGTHDELVAVDGAYAKQAALQLV